MFINAQQNNYKKALSLFLLLKLLHRQGKTKLTKEELLFIEYANEIRSRKTTQRYLKTLIKLKFISYNSRTGYYILISFDRIRIDKSWEVRLAFPIDYSNYNKINAVTGAIIFGYLHKDFWRKVKKEKSVHIKGRTYNFPTFNFNFKKKPAPVSVYGVQQIFNIPIATASRLKTAAKKEKYIKVKHNFEQITKDEAVILKYNGKKKAELRFRKGKYYLQSIDTVYPLFYFIKRKSLE